MSGTTTRSTIDVLVLDGRRRHRGLGAGSLGAGGLGAGSLGAGGLGAGIGEAAAKAAALAHAGVTVSQTTKMQVKQDWDDGRLEYEVEFDVGRTEYEYTIDGVTGAILEYKQDND